MYLLVSRDGGTNKCYIEFHNNKAIMEDNVKRLLSNDYRQIDNFYYHDEWPAKSFFIFRGEIPKVVTDSVKLI